MLERFGEVPCRFFSAGIGGQIYSSFFLIENLLLLLPKSKYFSNILHIQFGMEIVSKCNKKPFKVYHLSHTDLNPLLIFISHGILANDLTSGPKPPHLQNRRIKSPHMAVVKILEKCSLAAGTPVN